MDGRNERLYQQIREPNPSIGIVNISEIKTNMLFIVNDSVADLFIPFRIISQSNWHIQTGKKTYFLAKKLKIDPCFFPLGGDTFFFSWTAGSTFTIFCDFCETALSSSSEQLTSSVTSIVSREMKR